MHVECLSFIADLDYNSTRLNFTLSATEERHFFNVSIINDLKLENNETFSIIMSVPSSLMNVRLVTPEITLVIYEDDGTLDLQLNYYLAVLNTRIAG